MASAGILEAWISPSIPFSRCTNTPYGAILVTWPLCLLSVGYLAAITCHGSPSSRFRDKANLPFSSSNPMTITFTWSPSFNVFPTSSTFSQEISLICTNPSKTSFLILISTNAPNGTSPVTTPSYTSPPFTTLKAFFLASISAASDTALSLITSRFSPRFISITFTFRVCFSPASRDNCEDGINPYAPSASTSNPPRVVSLTFTSNISPPSWAFSRAFHRLSSTARRKDKIICPESDSGLTTTPVIFSPGFRARK